MVIKTIDMEEGWDCVQMGITKLVRIVDGLHESPFTSEEHMNLYTTIYNIYFKNPHDYPRQLYVKFYEEVEDYITGSVLPSLREKHDEFMLFMLRELVKRWKNYKVMVRRLSRLFYCIEYVIARNELPAFNEVGLTCFRDLVYRDGKVRDAVITLIDKEREGEQIDRALLKSVTEIFVEIGMGKLDAYEEYFEAQMLQDSGAYYSRKASNWILEDSCPDYMLKAEKCFKEERDRVFHYLHSSTEPKLMKRVQHELLVVYATQLLENEHFGCRVLLRDDKVEDLSWIYRLYHSIPQGLEPIAKIFKQHIAAEGTALVQQSEDAASNQHISSEGTALVQQSEDAASNQAANAAGVQKQVLVRKIIELHDKYMEYVTDFFQNHALFHKALKAAFEIFCNSSVAELLATVCDNIFKKGGSEKLSDEAIEDTLEKVLKLLVYVNYKDLFAEFYREKVACRLLSDQSAYDDHERSFCTKLKQRYGEQFISKMDEMVKDLTLARENQTSFEEYLKSTGANPGIDLTVTVLTTELWPSYKSSGPSLPVEMVKCIEVFEAFYVSKTKPRKLTWINSLGICYLDGNFEDKTIELIVSTSQAVLLLLFNHSDRLSYSEIITQLHLSHDDLVRLLHSLSCTTYKILIKEPNTKTISQTDYFEFNLKFTHKLKRIEIPLPPLVPPIDARRKVIEDVDKDRRYAIDAAILRIMKSRKVLGQQELVKECVEQLSRTFKPDIKAIKKRMEILISEEYVERDQENPSVFRYVP